MIFKQGPATDDIHAKTVLTPPKKYLSGTLLKLARKASSATISAELGKKGFRFVYMAGVRPLKPGTVMAGRAYTLRYLPRREDHNSYGPDRDKYAEHVGIESLGPGDVLVVDARGNTDAGVFGDRLIARMEYLGSAGLVTDGPCGIFRTFGRRISPASSGPPTDTATALSTGRWIRNCRSRVGT